MQREQGDVFFIISEALRKRFRLPCVSRRRGHPSGVLTLRACRPREVRRSDGGGRPYRTPRFGNGNEWEISRAPPEERTESSGKFICLSCVINSRGKGSHILPQGSRGLPPSSPPLLLTAMHEFDRRPRKREREKPV